MTRTTYRDHALTTVLHVLSGLAAQVAAKVRSTSSRHEEYVTLFLFTCTPTLHEGSHERE